MDQLVAQNRHLGVSGAVARFFFHTNNRAERSVQDDVGMDFPSVHEAKCAAVKYAAQLLSDSTEHFWDSADFELTITDQKGLILFSMRVVGIEAPAVRAAAKNTN
jgi:hypothetical protein